MRKYKLILITSILSLGIITACQPKVNPVTDIGEPETSQNKTKYEDQEKIETSQDHFDYIFKHQARLADYMESLDGEIHGTDNPNKEITSNVALGLEKLDNLANEYISYNNKVEESMLADKEYKLAMKSLKEYVNEIETNLKSGTLTDATGYDEIIDVMNQYIETYNEFEKIGIDTTVDFEGNSEK